MSIDSKATQKRRSQGWKWEDDLGRAVESLPGEKDDGVKRGVKRDVGN